MKQNAQKGMPQTSDPVRVGAAPEPMLTDTERFSLNNADMEKTIKINLQDMSFDVELHGISLNNIKDLSTISDDVAENLKRALQLLGADPKRTEDGVSLLRQGKRDIQYILQGCFSAPQNPNR